MKISKLLVLSTLGLVSLSANAANLVERTEPLVTDVATTPVAFEAGHQYLLFNKDAQMFFSQGNAWGTKASGNPNQEAALRLYFTKYLVDNAWDGETYTFNIYSSIRSTTYAWHEVFFDSETAMFVDRASQANLYWTVESQGGNVYRLAAANANPAIHGDGLYVGYDETVPQDESNLSDVYDNANAYPLHPKTSENVDWVFYDAQIFEVYEHAEQLKSVIEQAEEKGVDVSAAAAVYNNLNATVEQIDEAVTNLQKAMNSNIANGTAENPTDATSLFANPNFDDASYAGWQGTAPNMTGSGTHGPANCAEHYNKTYDTYQEFGGVPAGVFALRMKGFYRSGNSGPAYTNYVNGENYLAKLYAVTGEETFTADIVNPFSAQNTVSYAGATDFGTTASESSEGGFYVPNDPSAAVVYFGKGYYDNVLFFETAEGDLRVGLKKESSLSGDWTVFDQFTLTYYGNSAESYQKWVDLSVPQFDAQTQVFTPSYLDAYLTVVNTYKATNKAEAVAAVEAINGSEELAALLANIKAWLDWQAKVAEGSAIAADPLYADFAADLSEYCEFDAEDILDALELTTEELITEMAKIDTLIEEVKEEAKNVIKPNTDVTAFYMTNADFANGANGWTTGKGNVTYRVGIAEAYNTNFDVYQIIDKPQVGIYQLDLQGFFRMERDYDALNKYLAGEQITDAGVYINNNKTYLKCVFEEAITDEQKTAEGTQFTDGGFWQDSNGTGNWYANTMESATQTFQAGMYRNTAYGIVNKGEDLKVGVSGNVTGANWICWDNFKLTFIGQDDADANSYLLDKAMKDIDINKPMGKSVYASINEAFATANAALASNNAQQMFEALNTIFTLKTRVEESQALFAELNAANEDLMEAINNAGSAPRTVLTEANALFSEILGGIESRNFEDEEVEGLINQIKKMKTRLRLPADYAEATDLNGINVSDIIESAGFEDQGANSVKGWDTTGYNFGNDDTQRGAFALEFFNKTFDISQTILGLPEGIYELTVNAFCRVGGIAEDFAAFSADANATEAYLYGVNGDGEVSAAPIASLFKGALTEDPGISGQSEYTPEVAEGEDIVTYYIPNDMVSAHDFFNLLPEDLGHPNYYNNKVIVRVKADETLRIGIKKEVNSTNGWVIMDDFTLIYHGKNSEMVPDGDASQGISDMSEAPATVRVEFFTLDGRKAGAAQKGILIQKSTLQNGTIVVRKVRK